MAYLDYEKCEMYEHFLKKRVIRNFGRHGILIKNLHRNVIIYGCNNDVDVANEFAVHFRNVFKNSEDDNLTRAILTRVCVRVLSVVVVLNSGELMWS